MEGLWEPRLVVDLECFGACGCLAFKLYGLDQKWPFFSSLEDLPMTKNLDSKAAQKPQSESILWQCIFPGIFLCDFQNKSKCICSFKTLIRSRRSQQPAVQKTYVCSTQSADLQPPKGRVIIYWWVFMQCCASWGLCHPCVHVCLCKHKHSLMHICLLNYSCGSLFFCFWTSAGVCVGLHKWNRSGLIGLSFFFPPSGFPIILSAFVWIWRCMHKQTCALLIFVRNK